MAGFPKQQSVAMATMHTDPQSKVCFFAVPGHNFIIFFKHTSHMMDSFENRNVRSSCHEFLSVFRQAARFWILIEYDIEFRSPTEAENTISTSGHTK